jgi:hypothetical protein
MASGMNVGRKSGSRARSIACAPTSTSRYPNASWHPARDFPLGPFQEWTVAFGSDPILTGYIDHYLPEVEADRHAVSVTGRSKTEHIASIARPTSGRRFGDGRCTDPGANRGGRRGVRSGRATLSAAVFMAESTAHRPTAM